MASKTTFSIYGRAHCFQLLFCFRHIFDHNTATNYVSMQCKNREEKTTINVNVQVKICMLLYNRLVREKERARKWKKKRNTLTSSWTFACSSGNLLLFLRQKTKYFCFFTALVILLLPIYLSNFPAYESNCGRMHFRLSAKQCTHPIQQCIWFLFCFWNDANIVTHKNRSFPSFPYSVCH